MKKKLTLLASLLIAASSVTAFAAAVFTVNGQKVEKAVVHLTFEGDKVLLNYEDNSSTSHEFEHLAIKFDGSSAIANVNFSQLSVTVGTSLEVNGVEPGTELRVYDVNGRLVAQQVATDSNAVVDLSANPSGVYILSAGTEIVKFVKR